MLRLQSVRPGDLKVHVQLQGGLGIYHRLGFTWSAGHVDGRYLLRGVLILIMDCPDTTDFIQASIEQVGSHTMVLEACLLKSGNKFDRQICKV